MQYFKLSQLIVSLFILFTTSTFAQKTDIKQGYYLDTANRKITGFFDFDKLEENIVLFSPTNSEKGMKRLLPTGISKKLRMTQYLFLFKKSNKIMSANIFF
jgi:hypothetical protein